MNDNFCVCCGERMAEKNCESTVWEGLCANLSSKDDKAVHCYLTRKS